MYDFALVPIILLAISMGLAALSLIVGAIQHVIYKRKNKG